MQMCETCFNCQMQGKKVAKLSVNFIVQFLYFTCIFVNFKN